MTAKEYKYKANALLVDLMIDYWHQPLLYLRVLARGKFKKV